PGKSKIENRKSTIDHRPQMRRSTTREEPGVHHRRGAHASAWHRGEYGHFQHPKRRAAKTIALSKARAAGAYLSDVTAVTNLATLGVEIPSVQGAEQRLREHGGVYGRGAQFRRAQPSTRAVAWHPRNR